MVNTVPPSPKGSTRIFLYLVLFLIFCITASVVVLRYDHSGVSMLAFVFLACSFGGFITAARSYNLQKTGDRLRAKIVGVYQSGSYSGYGMWFKPILTYEYNGHMHKAVYLTGATFPINRIAIHTDIDIVLSPATPDVPYTLSDFTAGIYLGILAGIGAGFIGWLLGMSFYLKAMHP